jgi:hypothetical protein
MKKMNWLGMLSHVSSIGHTGGGLNAHPFAEGRASKNM